MDAFHLSALVGGAVILLAAIGVFRWLPARASDDPRPATGGPTGDLPAVSSDAVTGGAPVLPAAGDLVPSES
jgi:hypothetical protein